VILTKELEAIYLNLVITVVKIVETLPSSCSAKLCVHRGCCEMCAADYAPVCLDKRWAIFRRDAALSKNWCCRL